MKLAGFSFNKVSIERFSDNFKDLKMDTNLSISNIKELNQTYFKTKEGFIVVEFTFMIDYKPKIAKLEFNGKIVFSLDLKKMKEILKDWDLKKIEEELRIAVFNIILRKANIKALQLEDEMGLPPHLNLPSIRKNEGTKKEK